MPRDVSLPVPFVRHLRCRRGIATLELAFILPLLLLLILGVAKFGIALKDYLVLTSAAQQGAQTLALSRGTAAPYATAVAAITGAAPTLTAGNMTISMTVGGTACTSNSCAISAAGQMAVVMLSYPCDLAIMGTNFGGSACSISAQTGVVVQ